MLYCTRIENERRGYEKENEEDYSICKTGNSTLCGGVSCAYIHVFCKTGSRLYRLSGCQSTGAFVLPDDSHGGIKKTGLFEQMADADGDYSSGMLVIIRNGKRRISARKG